MSSRRSDLTSLLPAGGVRVLSPEELEDSVRRSASDFLEPGSRRTRLELWFHRLSRKDLRIMQQGEPDHRPTVPSACNLILSRDDGPATIRVLTLRGSDEEHDIRRRFSALALVPDSDAPRDPDPWGEPGDDDWILMCSLPSAVGAAIDLVVDLHMRVAVRGYAGRLLFGYRWRDETGAGRGHGKAWIDGQLAKSRPEQPAARST